MLGGRFYLKGLGGHKTFIYGLPIEGVKLPLGFIIGVLEPNKASVVFYFAEIMYSFIDFM